MFHDKTKRTHQGNLLTFMMLSLLNIGLLIERSIWHRLMLVWIRLQIWNKTRWVQILDISFLKWLGWPRGQGYARSDKAPLSSDPWLTCRLTFPSAASVLLRKTSTRKLNSQKVQITIKIKLLSTDAWLTRWLNLPSEIDQVGNTNYIDNEDNWIGWKHKR